MDTSIERQIIRVFGAFQRAADKRWGPEHHTRAARPPRDYTKDPKWQKALDYMRANPSASNPQAKAATGASKHLLTEVRRVLGIQGTVARGLENRLRIIEAHDADPSLSAREIAKKLGVRERLAQETIQRTKMERRRADA